MIKTLVHISLVLIPLGIALAQGEALAQGQDIAAPKAVLQQVETGRRIELPVEVQVHYLGTMPI